MNKYLYCKLVDNHVITCYQSKEEHYYYQYIATGGIKDVAVTDNFLDAETAYYMLFREDY